MTEYPVNCPFCWETFNFLLDPDQGSDRVTVDCEICCRAVAVTVQVDLQTGTVSVSADRESD
ncbi:MAG: CPXCG motif-containing cysteine-rich protein [Xanthomonadales bacterium]|nr:CPXCG motif-containing cysteine-rich protein [Xanthomonadales bacterium]